MTEKDARLAAERTKRLLRGIMRMDIKVETINLATYENAKDFYLIKSEFVGQPITYEIEELVIVNLAKKLRAKGYKTNIMKFHVGSYLRWLATTTRKNTAESRSAFLIDPANRA